MVCPDHWIRTAIDEETKCIKSIGRHRLDRGLETCVKHGGVLPTPRNENENDDYRKLLDRMGLRRMQLGFDDLAEEDVWRNRQLFKKLRQYISYVQFNTIRNILKVLPEKL